LRHLLACGQEELRNEKLQVGLEQFYSHNLLNWVEALALLDEFPALSSALSLLEHKGAVSNFAQVMALI
jgi:hypothetical protein